MSIKVDEYQQRIVTFIDILGFKDHVDKTVHDTEHFQDIKHALNHLADWKQKNDGKTMNMKELGREVTVFSDSIVISYPASYKSAGFFLFLDIIHLQLEMLSVGILLRGGVSEGLLIHDDNIVYGPAMIAAYQLENLTAKYPRVLVDIEALRLAITNGHHPVEEETEAIENLLEIDTDGNYYIDYLSQWEEINSNEEYLELLTIAREFIIETLHSYEEIETERILTNTEEKVRAKYIWQKEYYNKSIGKLSPKYSEGLIIE